MVLSRSPFLERPSDFFSPESCFVCHVCLQYQSFNNFESCTMKLSIKKAKLTGLWAMNCASVQEVLILKFPFGARTFSVLLSNGSQFFFSLRHDQISYLLTTMFVVLDFYWMQTFFHDISVLIFLVSKFSNVKSQDYYLGVLPETIRKTETIKSNAIFLPIWIFQ